MTEEIKKAGYAVLVVIIAVGIVLFIRDSKIKRISEAWTDFNGAEEIKDIQKAFDDHKETEAAPWIAFQLGNKLFQDEKFDEAAAKYNYVANNHKAHYLAPFALAAQANCLETKGKTQEAKTLRDKLKRDYLESVPALL